jgi:hypothetical protein
MALTESNNAPSLSLPLQGRGRQRQYKCSKINGINPNARALTSQSDYRQGDNRTIYRHTLLALMAACADTSN